MQSLKLRVLFGIAIPTLLILVVLAVALSLPRTEMHFFAADTHLMVSIPDGNRHRVEEVQGFSFSDRWFPADPHLVIDEPDVLPTHSDIHDLMARIGALSDALLVSGSGTGVELVVHTDSAEYPLAPQERHIADLTGEFWLQVGAAFAALLICTLVWLPGQLNTGKYGFILTGVGYFMALTSAGIYSTRDLFIDADVFRVLSLMNTFSTYVFLSGLSLLFWNYPRQLLTSRSNWLLTLSPLALILLAAVPLHNDLALTIYLPFSLLLLIPLAGIIMQWRRNHDSPRNRAILRWILFMLVSITIPALLKLYSPIPQSVLLFSVVFIYAGIMVAITRHQMFDIERWSYRLWGWFLGGLAVVLTDLLLATMISLSPAITLTLSMAIVGWIYFPLRQWAWRRFFERQSHRLDDWLTLALPELLTMPEKTAAGKDPLTHLEQALDAVFQPLKTERVRLAEEGLQAQGSQLTILYADELGLRLHHPAAGRRQFSRNDLDIARMVVGLYELVSQSMTARVEGAREERARIRQDLHDDLGAKLLRLLHRSQAKDKPLVKEAIRDLRTLLQKQSHSGSPVQVVLKQWLDEASLRCRDHEIPLRWQDDTGTTANELSAVAISQASMAMREAISNAIRHRSGGPVTLSATTDESVLKLTISNDTVMVEPAGEDSPNSGLGLTTMKERMQRCGGSLHVSVSRDDNSGQIHSWDVILCIPLTSPP